MQVQSFDSLVISVVKVKKLWNVAWFLYIYTIDVLLIFHTENTPSFSLLYNMWYLTFQVEISNLLILQHDSCYL